MKTWYLFGCYNALTEEYKETWLDTEFPHDFAPWTILSSLLDKVTTNGLPSGYDAEMMDKYKSNKRIEYYF